MRYLKLNQTYFGQRLPPVVKYKRRRKVEKPITPVDPDYCEGCPNLRYHGHRYYKQNPLSVYRDSEKDYDELVYKCDLGYGTFRDGKFDQLIYEDLDRPKMCIGINGR